MTSVYPIIGIVCGLLLVYVYIWRRSDYGVEMMFGFDMSPFALIPQKPKYVPPKYRIALGNETGLKPGDPVTYESETVIWIEKADNTSQELVGIFEGFDEEGYAKVRRK